ncbi:MAG: hypothetical protein HYW03_24100 [Deltaproteobacteria bacterium]|nr:hypothetical protein [Deltaproteobacteria bacterium]
MGRKYLVEPLLVAVVSVLWTERAVRGMSGIYHSLGFGQLEPVPRVGLDYCSRLE